MPTRNKPPKVLPFQTATQRAADAHANAGADGHKRVLTSFAAVRKEAVEAKNEGSPFCCTAIAMIGASEAPGDPGGLRSRYSVCCAGHATYLLGAVRELESYLVDFIRAERETDDDPEETETP